MEITVFFANAMGGGFADPVTVPEGCPVVDLFHRKMGADKSPADYLIRVNKQRPTASQALQSGDRVEVLPNKVSGA